MKQQLEQLNLIYEKQTKELTELYKSKEKQEIKNREIETNIKELNTKLENETLMNKKKIDEKDIECSQVKNMNQKQNDDIKNLNEYLDKIFQILYNDDTTYDDEFYNNKIEEINKFCEELYQKINRMDLSVNVLNASNICLSNTDGINTDGTSIEDLLKLRQEEEIQELLNNND